MGSPIVRSLPLVLAAGCVLSTREVPDRTSEDGLPDGGGFEDAGGGEVPDAGEEADCLLAPTYDGSLYAARAYEENRNSFEDRFLALDGDLDASAQPDRLSIVNFFARDGELFGYATGIFALPSSDWLVTICADFNADGPPGCAAPVAVISGALEISDTEDRLTGLLSGVVFVDESHPGCQSRIASLAFSRPIE